MVQKVQMVQIIHKLSSASTTLQQLYDISMLFALPPPPP